MKGISRLSSSHYNITEQLETLLLVWINKKQMAGDSVSEAIICEKVKRLFEGGNKEKKSALQMRTIKRCSVAGINCPNL